MGNRHFETTMARATERNEVIHDIRRGLILIEPSSFQMVYVEFPAARAAGDAATLADLIPVENHKSNSVPITPQADAFPSAPMGAFGADHCSPRAHLRTESTRCRVPLRRAKFPTAELAQLDDGGKGGGILAFARATEYRSIRLSKGLSALYTDDHALMAGPIVPMAPWGAEGERLTHKSKRWPLEVLTTIGAHLDHH